MLPSSAWRFISFAACLICMAAGVWVWVAYSARATGITLIVLGAAQMIALLVQSRDHGAVDDDPEPDVTGREPDRIERLPEQRRNELIRGTSMHLRDMRYRYSIRFDRSDRACFTTEVNSITLGFVPVIILDNHTDRQGLGYVAFPYDGDRWRGPGLPCGGDPDQAVAHAAKCVSPLSPADVADEEFEGEEGDERN